MQLDFIAETLKKDSNRLTPAQAINKMTVLINLYHSIDLRYGTEFEKLQIKQELKREVFKLKKRVGNDFAKNCSWYLQDKHAWNAVKESFLK